MKKRIFSLCFLAATGGLFAQKYVSTEPSNKVAIIEEYTGIGCGYCPDGHRIVAETMEEYKGKVYGINIHQGGYAKGYLPDLTTAFGDALFNQTGGNSYPTGSVNRHVFSGSKTAVARTTFKSSARQIIASPAYVNIGGKAVVDYQSRSMEIEIEVYYTGNPSEIANKLNIALLQNNILGPQSGMNYNPTQIVNGQYNHKHALRHLITGQWGQEIPNTQRKKDSLLTFKFTYNIPTEIKDVPLKLIDLELLAFLTEGSQEIVNACQIPISFINAPDKMFLIEGIGVKIEPTKECNSIVNIRTKAKNAGDKNIDHIVFSYLNGDQREDFPLRFDKPILPGEEIELIIPISMSKSSIEEKVSLELAKVNGEDYIFGDQRSIKNLILKKHFALLPENTSSIELELNQDRWGNEITWKLMDNENLILSSGGPYEDLAGIGVKKQQETVKISKNGCLRFIMFDSGKDGINTKHGEGNFSLLNSKGELLTKSNGKYESSEIHYIGVGRVSNSDASLVNKNNFTIYPNPAKDFMRIILDLSQGSELNMDVYDIQGRLVKHLPKYKVPSGKSEIEIKLYGIKSGIYFLKVQGKGIMLSHKLMIY